MLLLSKAVWKGTHSCRWIPVRRWVLALRTCASFFFLGRNTHTRSKEVHSRFPWDERDGEKISARALSILYPAMESATGAERIHFLSTMVFSPHFHAWLFPGSKEENLLGIPFLAADHSCSEAEHWKLSKRSRLKYRTPFDRLERWQ